MCAVTKNHKEGFKKKSVLHDEKDYFKSKYYLTLIL
jgi:hypothetical protein